VVTRLGTAWPELTPRLVTCPTTGDRTPDRPIAELAGVGVFARELERGLLTGELDLVVHSLKDLPVASTEDLTIGAVCERDTVGDVLVCSTGGTLADLPGGATVGTSSPRRRAQVLRARGDVSVQDLRGNVDTRMQRVRDGAFDAIVLAEAGVRRLDLWGDDVHALPPAVMLPAPGQGAIAVQCRADDAPMLELLSPIDDPDARAAVDTERAVLAGLGGGCAVPVGAWAVVEGGRLTLHAAVFAPDGSDDTRVEITGPAADGEALARDAARQLLDTGASVWLR